MRLIASPMPSIAVAGKKCSPISVIIVGSRPKDTILCLYFINSFIVMAFFYATNSFFVLFVPDLSFFVQMALPGILAVYGRSS